MGQNVYEAIDAATNRARITLGNEQQRAFTRDAIQLTAEDPDCCRIAVPYLKKKIQSHCGDTQLLALFVLREMMQTGHFPLKQRVAHPEFLNSLARVLKRPTLRPAVKSEILSLLSHWANDFAHDADLFPSISALRTQLVAEGYPIAAAPLANIYDNAYRRGVDASLQKRVRTIHQAAKTARGLLKNLEDDSAEPSKNATVTQIIANLQRDIGRMQRLIAEETSGDSMSALLETNDYAIETIKMYHRQQSRCEASTKNRYSLPPPHSSGSKPAVSSTSSNDSRRRKVSRGGMSSMSSMSSSRRDTSGRGGVTRQRRERSLPSGSEESQDDSRGGSSSSSSSGYSESDSSSGSRGRTSKSRRAADNRSRHAEGGGQPRRREAEFPPAADSSGRYHQYPQQPQRPPPPPSSPSLPPPYAMQQAPSFQPTQPAARQFNSYTPIQTGSSVPPVAFFPGGQFIQPSPQQHQQQQQPSPMFPSYPSTSPQQFASLGQMGAAGGGRFPAVPHSPRPESHNAMMQHPTQSRMQGWQRYG